MSYHLEPPGPRFGPGSTLYFLSAGADANPYGDEAVFELEVGVRRPSDVGRGRLALGHAHELVSTSGRARGEPSSTWPALLETEERWLWDSLFAPARKEYGFSVQRS